MSFHVSGVGGDGGSERLGSFRGLAGGKQIEAALGKGVGGGRIGHGWF